MDNSRIVQLDVEGKILRPYVIDSSSLINLKKWYPLRKATFRPVWDKIESFVKSDILISHYEVYRELCQRDDDLFGWCKKNEKMFKDEYDYGTLGEVEKKYDQKYWNRNISNTNPWADPWVIVLAIKNKATIVTDENKNENNRIPKIGSYFGISSINSTEFIESILP